MANGTRENLSSRHSQSHGRRLIAHISTSRTLLESRAQTQCFKINMITNKKEDFQLHQDQGSQLFPLAAVSNYQEMFVQIKTNQGCTILDFLLISNMLIYSDSFV